MIDSLMEESSIINSTIPEHCQDYNSLYNSRRDSVTKYQSFQDILYFGTRKVPVVCRSGSGGHVHIINYLSFARGLPYLH